MTTTEARAALIAHNPNNTYVVIEEAWYGWGKPNQDRVDYRISWFLNRENDCETLQSSDLELLLAQALAQIPSNARP